MSNRPRLYAMVGLPFAGKSTLAASISKLIDVPIVSVDIINASRGVGRGNIQITNEEWSSTYKQAWADIGALLGQGSSVIFDAANIDIKERSVANRFAVSHAADCLFIYLPVSKTVAHRRIVENRLLATRHNVPDDLFRRVASRLVAPTKMERHVVYRGEDVAEWLGINASFFNE